MFDFKQFTEEHKFFIYLFVALFLWFIVIVNLVLGFMLDNFFIAYIIFTVIYTYFAFKYVLQLGDPLKDNKLFFAFILVEFVHDVITFPYLVTKAGVIDAPIEALFSTDVFLYKLLPAMPEIFKYFGVYVIMPTVILMIARTAAGKRAFWKAIKH